MTERADLGRPSELEVKPLLSPNISFHDGRLDGGALELLSEASVVELVSHPGPLTAAGRAMRGSTSGADSSI